MKPSPSRLFAVRHGETEWNTLGRFQGLADTSLSPRGHIQVIACAEQLQPLLLQGGVKGATSVYSSPLRRARQSASMLCDRLGFDDQQTRVDKRLSEMSFGKWEGLTTLEVKARYPEERRARKIDRWNFAPSGGESPDSVAQRMAAFLADLPSSGTAVIVAHSGNIRALFHLLGGMPRDEALRTEVPHDAVFIWDGARFCLSK